MWVIGESQSSTYPLSNGCGKFKFGSEYNEKIVIDEVQYTTNLLKTIKLIIDKKSKKGQMIFTGSQSYDLLFLVSKYLVGRVSIIELPSLPLREKYKFSFSRSLIPNEKYLKERKRKNSLVGEH